MYKLKHSLVALSLILVCSSSHAAPRDVSHSTSAEHRMEYIHKLLDSKSGQRLSQHKNGSTKTKVDNMVQQAQAAIKDGDNTRADELSKQALNIIMKAVRELPENPEEIAHHKQRYKNMLQGVTKFGYAQEDNKQRFAAESSNKDYNQQQVARLVELAEKDAAKGNYEKAIVRLDEAQTIITASLQGILNNKQLVIELDIGTPEKEYFYELRRFTGHHELIPIAIDVKKPNTMAAETMVKLGEKAEWMSEQAREKAIEGDYPVAIRMMMDATATVKQALRIVGVNF